jgi:hypothetical protein
MSSDFSEESTASVFREEEQAKQETSKQGVLVGLFY